MDKIPKEIKKIIENYIIFKPKTNKELKVAVDLWCENKENALKLYGHIYNWNTCLITNMDYLFSYKTNFNENINYWDVSNVINMSCTFLYAESFNKPLNKWNVSNVQDMRAMFSNARSFNQDLSSWDVSNVRIMGSLFRNAQSFNKPLGSWNLSNISDMGEMFYDASSFNQSQSLNNWKLNLGLGSNVIYIKDMFYGVKNINLENVWWIKP